MRTDKWSLVAEKVPSSPTARSASMWLSSIVVLAADLRPRLLDEGGGVAMCASPSFPVHARLRLGCDVLLPRRDATVGGCRRPVWGIEGIEFVELRSWGKLCA